MSGDVQPRKRKDKRRKRDDRKSEGDLTDLRQSSFQDDDESSHGVHITKMGNDDVHLHVHHDHGTGGHWCAKIIFFSLMAALLGLVALIIMENRGLEDLDTPLSESRFSNYFDGWVDEHRAEHEAHDVQEPSGEALDDHDEHDELEDHEEDEHEEEEPLSAELEEDEATPEEDEEEVDQEDEEPEEDEEEEEGEEENNAGENITAEDDVEDDEADEEDEEEEEEVEPTVETTTEATAEYEEDEDNVDEGDADDEEAPESQEAPPSKAPEEEDDDQPEEEEEVEKSVEPAAAADDDENNDDNDEDNDDDDFESLDQDVQDEPEKVVSQKLDQDDKDNNEEKDPQEEGSSWLASQIKPKEAPVENNELFEQELRKANEEMIRENYAQALRSFNMLTLRYADEPLAHLGKAKVLAHLAELQQSNQRLWEAIDAYKRYLAFEDLIVSDAEFIAAGESCIKHLRFLGNHHQAVNIHEILIERLPRNPHLRNQLSLTYLMANNIRQVEKVSFNTLKIAPDDPMAQLHYGLVLKQLHGDYPQALPFLKYAVESEAEGTQEAFFYLALGETLQRLSRQSEAIQVFSKGVAKGFFTSQYQRSLYNVPGLKAQPFWAPEETGYQRHLEKLQFHWRTIRDEALEVMGKTGLFADETELLRDKGVWQQFELFSQGLRMGANCQKTPKTCALVQQFPESSGCRRGQVKFSVMKANTHVWPHCGPTNCRLRAHLTLVAPEPEKTVLRVAEQERTWREGELFIFDDSFEHEVWHNGSLPRLVLILDMWHPELSAHQRRSLPAI
ncbi:aspartyl/asparaginyl beta-hydroxylase isoform X2 [Drosophila bipectinata]|uniref:aspartyl/asparaginyl beta-hydroxylase isoform X2 n=1 Tax=Drosophila bipectinata TaxID=42026 RepID=UPI0038B3B6EE